ncbi:unnamed protein product [Rhizophagus irregularis]|nr:unnamed protein product [Rhizophagus irregularis]
MTHQSITLNGIPPYILAKIRFFIHEFCKFYEFFFLAHLDPTGFGKHTQIADHFVPLSGGPAINILIVYLECK